MKTIQIGSGAGYSGDRIEPALACGNGKANIHYIIFPQIDRYLTSLHL